MSYNKHNAKIRKEYKSLQFSYFSFLVLVYTCNKDFQSLDVTFRVNEVLPCSYAQFYIAS